MNKADLKGLSGEEMGALVCSMGEKPYRARQLMRWIYKRGACDIAGFTDLSSALRKTLMEKCRVSSLAVIEKRVSRDGTVKYLFELEDGERIESVLVAHPRGPAICVSTQVGCKRACLFCLSGKKGLRRNLTAGEIIDQALALRRDIPQGRSWSIVLMGMGEPLDNYHNTVKAIRLMADGDAMGISPRRITLSTVGPEAELRDFAKEGLPVNLAVSLNAPDDETRNRLMPASRGQGIRGLLEGCRAYPLDKRSKPTFEYVMIGGVNDSMEQAVALGKLLRGQRCRINLIPFNPFSSSTLAPPPKEAILLFQKRLASMGLRAIIRESRGGDVGAACGQLTQDKTFH